MTNVPPRQPENTNQHDASDNKTDETLIAPFAFGPHLPTDMCLRTLEFQLGHISEIMELLLQRSFENQHKEKDSSDAEFQLETSNGPKKSPRTKGEDKSTDDRMDTF
ncbi:hypothetical protein FH972_015086 [Carpinus fangiana]|uniref:Uncharacterized protein n=1 Tax=Carpinus fangiana TaxID=176857 RepID=A0A5N6RCQ1_9ROSI|nr:hypothetical protein FH972_015086 [Carpinus fangiana]